MEACLSLCNKRLVREAREREFEDDMGERERESKQELLLTREDGAPLFAAKNFLPSRESEKDKDREDGKLFFRPLPFRSSRK